MGLSESVFPKKNISEISLSIEDNSEVNKEKMISEFIMEMCVA